MEIYYWELKSEAIGSLRFYPSLAGYVFGFLISSRLHHLFDKKIVIVITAVMLSVFPALPVVMRLLGVFPDNHTAMLIPALVFCAALGALAGSILNISVMSALADVADEIDLKHGLRQEGILYSARTFFAKLDSSIGHGIATFSMWLISFPKKAIPGKVDEEIVWWLGVIDSPMTILPGLIAAFFYSKYRIDRKQYEETRQGLMARDAKA